MRDHFVFMLHFNSAVFGEIMIIVVTAKEEMTHLTKLRKWIRRSMVCVLLMTNKL